MAKITDKALRAKSTTKNQWLRESMIWGHGSLLARITPAGERLFYFEYTDSNKKRVALPIGTFGSGVGLLSLAEARQKAMELASLHKSGIPDLKEHFDREEKLHIATREAELARIQAEQTAIESKLTVTQLFEHWAKVDLINRKDGGAEVRRMFQKDVLPIIGYLHVADIKKGHFTEVTDLLLARGVNRMANLIFSLMRQMFRFAVDRDIIEHDPSANIRKSKIGGKQVERDRVLNEDEIQLLAMKLPKANLLIPSQLAVWISLSTCCRIGELLSARWEHIDLEKGVWVIPAESSKNGRLHTIYLSDFAKQQFQALRNINGESAYCYPNRADDGPISSKTVTKQLGDRQKSADGSAYSNRTKHMQALVLPHGKWTPHDLRRTGATLMTALGVLPEVAERCLNHIEENKVKRTYQRHSYQKEMAEAWVLLGAHVAQLVS